MTTIALKEWAVAIKALRDGRQTLLVRKGGISEESRHFRIQSEMFALFPTYEHQAPELLQAPYQEDLAQVLASRADPTRATLDTWAVLTDQFEVTEPWQVEAVSEHYCWSLRYAEERLRWKPRHPLLVLAVRAYRLATPLDIELRPEHGGCKSWLTLEESASTANMTAVLSDHEYASRVAAVRAALEQRGPVAARA